VRVAPEPLEESLTPSRVMLPFLMKEGLLGFDRFLHWGRDVLPAERASPTPGRAPIG